MEHLVSFFDLNYCKHLIVHNTMRFITAMATDLLRIQYDVKEEAKVK